MRFKVALPRLLSLSFEEAQQATVVLREAQHVLAREYGFANWKLLSDLVKASSQDEALGKLYADLARNTWTGELQQLIDEAQAVSVETSVLTTSEGDLVHLARRVLPGMGLRLSKPEDPAWRMMRVESLPSRPRWYPQAVPFLAHHTAWVALDGKNQYASWRFASLEKEIHPDMSQFLESPMWKYFTQTVQPLMAQVREGKVDAKKKLDHLMQDDEARQRWGKEIKELAERAQPHLEDTSPDAEQVESMVQAVVEQSIDEGWALGQEKGSPFMRFIHLERPAARRDVQVLNATSVKWIQLWDFPIK